MSGLIGDDQLLRQQRYRYLAVIGHHVARAISDELGEDEAYQRRHSISSHPPQLQFDDRLSFPALDAAYWDEKDKGAWEKFFPRKNSGLKEHLPVAVMIHSAATKPNVFTCAYDNPEYAYNWVLHCIAIFCMKVVELTLEIDRDKFPETHFRNFHSVIHRLASRESTEKGDKAAEIMLLALYLEAAAHGFKAKPSATPKATGGRSTR